MASSSNNSSSTANNHGGHNPLNRLSLKSAGKRNQESMSHSQPNGGWINGKAENPEENQRRSRLFYGWSRGGGGTAGALRL